MTVILPQAQTFPRISAMQNLPLAERLAQTQQSPIATTVSVHHDKASIFC